MSYETVEVLRDGGVATLWMNRPERRAKRAAAADPS